MVAADARKGPTTRPVLRKVVIVNGSVEILDWLEATLDVGRYEVFVVDDGARAYSQVRAIMPDLVVLCARIEDTGAFQFLTMLKLDEATRRIPVHTYTTEWEGQRLADEVDEMADLEVRREAAPRTFRLN